jgi:hypothetical protein
LLELECVRRAEQELPGPGPLALPEALVALLREFVLEFRDEPQGVLLTIVLGLESEYTAVGGEVYAPLDLSAAERRALAGREFRGGRHAVGANAIRLHHEPEAVGRLAHLLLRREIELSGFMSRDEGDEATYVPLYLPGETAPKSGIYVVSDFEGTPLGREANLGKGERFPLTLMEPEEVGWLAFVRSTT